MSVNKFRLGWHAYDKMAANRATNSKFFPGLLPPNFGGVQICTPSFLILGPGEMHSNGPKLTSYYLSTFALYDSSTAGVYLNALYRILLK